MQLTCDLIVERAQRLAVSAVATRTGAVREQRTELSALVARHLEEAERACRPSANARCSAIIGAVRN